MCCKSGRPDFYHKKDNLMSMELMSTDQLAASNLPSGSLAFPGVFSWLSRLSARWSCPILASSAGCCYDELNTLEHRLPKATSALLSQRLSHIPFHKPGSRHRLVIITHWQLTCLIHSFFHDLISMSVPRIAGWQVASYKQSITCQAMEVSGFAAQVVRGIQQSLLLLYCRCWR